MKSLAAACLLALLLASAPTPGAADDKMPPLSLLKGTPALSDANHPKRFTVDRDKGTVEVVPVEEKDAD